MSLDLEGRLGWNPKVRIAIVSMSTHYARRLRLERLATNIRPVFSIFSIVYSWKAQIEYLIQLCPTNTVKLCKTLKV